MVLGEAGVELACDVALEAADGFGFGFAFGAAALEVVAGGGVIGEAGDDDASEGAVGLSVTGPAESVSLLLAAGGVERCSSAEASEGTFVSDPVGVLARGDEERAGGVGADAEPVEQLGGGVGDQRCQDGVERQHFLVECVDPAGEALEREAGC